MGFLGDPRKAASRRVTAGDTDEFLTGAFLCSAAGGLAFLTGFALPFVLAAGGPRASMRTALVCGLLAGGLAHAASVRAYVVRRRRAAAVGGACGALVLGSALACAWGSALL